MKWFTSDIHHKHRRIVEFTNRGVDTTIENHDDWLVEVWNKKILPGDTVYHLGDFSFSHKKDKVEEFARKLNGNKILIKGNHDNTDVLYWLVARGAIQAWYDYKEIKIGPDKDHHVVLFHFPISSWHKQGYGSYHLHGHCHGNLKPEFSEGKILDVGLDSIYNIYGEHSPISEEQIIRYMENKPVRLNDHHKEHKDA